MKYAVNIYSKIMKPIYDPLEFIGKIELFTIAIIGSFITMKFLNAMYENIYEPMVDVIVDSEKTDNYYVKIGNYYVQMGMIVKEFIKWFLLIILLMIIYNLFIHKKK
ncbi:putative orfan [Tupanvirus soda lake]|uniref:Orfan n=2 Tax=Tupanvirus TaxID=2094720 RepID=A0AC62ACK3_9VIRU|nr:putative orfan [Tupanvirus soda lake]QKU35526.1 putative orfan [Tupanvirus soda lake]